MPTKDASARTNASRILPALWPIRPGTDDGIIGTIHPNPPGPGFPGRQCRPSRVARESTYPEIAIFIPKEAYEIYVYTT